MNEFNHRCTCGGIMNQQTKLVGPPGSPQAEVWYVCPFCGEKRQAKTAAQAQDEGKDQLLTQA